MSKAILVLDIPTKCEECCCYIDDYKHSYLCRATNKKVDTEENKPYWCPLKPLPPKISQYWFRQEMIADGLQNDDGSVAVFSKDYEEGWNNCIDEILGEEDE